MKAANIPFDEEKRLEALSKYELLDLANEKIFDQITTVASIICDVPICLISIIDKNKQWFLSNHGLEDTIESPRDVSFCGHAILENKLMEIKDSKLDDRFHDNPFVQGNPHIRFYAGMPLINPEGYKLGTICLIDNKPRALEEKQAKLLELLSNIIITIFETRKGVLRDMNKILDLEAQSTEISQFKSAIIKSISEVIIAVSKSGQILFADEKANNLFGYSQRELLDKNISSLFIDDIDKLVKGDLIKVQGIKKDQSKIPIEVSASPLIGSNHIVLVIKESDNNPLHTH